MPYDGTFFLFKECFKGTFGYNCNETCSECTTANRTCESEFGKCLKVLITHCYHKSLRFCIGRGWRRLFKISKIFFFLKPYSLWVDEGNKTILNLTHFLHLYTDKNRTERQPRRKHGGRNRGQCRKCCDCYPGCHCYYCINKVA